MHGFSFDAELPGWRFHAYGTMLNVRLVVVLFAAAAAAAAIQVPSGTQVQIRLTKAVNTATAKANEAFEAVVIAPVLAGGQAAIAAGAIVTGHIKEAKSPVKPEDQAVLNLAFDRIGVSGRKAVSFAARLVDVDNARESVDAQGKILGIIASQTGSGRLDQGINKVSERYPGLGDILSAVKQAVVKDADPNIDYEPGVEMTIELTEPLEWKANTSNPNVAGIEPSETLFGLVNGQPFRTISQKPPRPSDMTNLMFLGSEQDIENAFAKAGWSTAEQLNAKSKLETFRAMTELRGYKEAPVSTLLLDDVPPDLVFQKQNNTFNARHHLRIWHRHGKFNGKDIWVCAATHDIGIDYSERDHTFIHKVDSKIDLERAKVVNDLLFTKLVQGLALVDRPEVPTNLYNATGDQLETDGKMAVLSF